MNIGDAAAGLGLPVFPCDSRNHPIVAGGFKAASSDPQVIADAFRKPGAERIGVPTGLASGFVVIDVDVKNGRDGTQWLEANAARLPATRTHRTISGGMHLLFRNPEAVELRNSAGKIAPGIDVRANGGYIVAPPSPGYSVVKDLPPAEMPDWLVQLCAPAPPPVPPLQVVQRSNGNGDTGRYAETALENEVHIVEAALEGTRNHTLNVAAVKLGGLVAGGLLARGDVEASLLAAALATGLTQHEARATIKSGLDFGARQPRSPPPRDERRTNGHDFGPPPEPDDPGYFASLEADAGHGTGQDGTPEPEPPLPLLWFDDINASLEAIDFVQGVLTERGAAVVYGDSHAGKTFWTTDLALHIASGRSWNGRRVEQGGVIYCVLEGNHGFRNRVVAWKQKNPGTQVHFAAVPAQINLLDPDADTQRLVETIKIAAQKMGTAVKLVVIDTLSRALAGGNENAPDDMGALIMNMDTIRATTQANVLFVHHCGKDQAKGARGHSCLRAAIDTEIEVQSDEDTGRRTATIVKQRDLDTRGINFEFRLDRAVLGQNQHGEEVTTCLVVGEGEAHGSPGLSKARLTPTEEAWFLELLSMFEEANSDQAYQPRGVMASASLPLRLTKSAVREGFKKRGRFALTADGMLTGADRTAMSKYLNLLRDKGKIGMTEEVIWLL